MIEHDYTDEEVKFIMKYLVPAFIIILCGVLVYMVWFYLAHQCPPGEFGRFIDNEFYCINKSLMEGGVDFEFARSIA